MSASSHAARAVATRSSTAAAPFVRESSSGSSPFGQRRDPGVQPGVAHRVARETHGLLPGGVTVEEEHDARRKALEELRLLHRERGAERRDDVGRARARGARRRRSCLRRAPRLRSCGSRAAPDGCRRASGPSCRSGSPGELMYFGGGPASFEPEPERRARPIARRRRLVASPRGRSRSARPLNATTRPCGSITANIRRWRKRS